MAVMTVAAQATALAALLGTIDGIGMVHQQRRQLRSEEDIIRWLCPVPAEGENPKINGWMISLAPNATTVTKRHPGHHGIGVKGGGNVFTTFQWQIEGYYQLDETVDSETLFRNLAWGVADELNSYGLLSIAGISMQLPSDLEVFGYAMLAGSHFTHYAKVTTGFQGRTRPA